MVFEPVVFEVGAPRGECHESGAGVVGLAGKEVAVLDHDGVVGGGVDEVGCDVSACRLVVGTDEGFPVGPHDHVDVVVAEQRLDGPPVGVGGETRDLPGTGDRLAVAVVVPGADCAVEEAADPSVGGYGQGLGIPHPGEQKPESGLDHTGIVDGALEGMGDVARSSGGDVVSGVADVEGSVVTAESEVEGLVPVAVVLGDDLELPMLCVRAR